MFNERLDDIVSEIAENYELDEVSFYDKTLHFPNRDVIINIIKDLRRVLFPRYFGEPPCGAGPKYFIGATLSEVESNLHAQVRDALLFRDGNNDEEAWAIADKQASNICSRFFFNLPNIQALLFKDVEAAFDGDPAAQSKAEIIYSYPGFLAITIQRLAHELYLMDVPLIPRIMTEYGHSLTGVDIHPGAEIGEYFFIDHATGVVIGETSVIGNNVKIYQGVTLGALSTRAGQRLAGAKRHPTIEDNVTIYSNSSVLGGDTVIGEGSVIAGSAFVTSSVPPNSRVLVKGQDVQVCSPDDPSCWII